MTLAILHARPVGPPLAEPRRMRTPFAVLVLAGSLLFSSFAAAQDAALAAPAFDAAGEQAMLERLNALRAERSLAPLARDAALDAVARGHSVDMANRRNLAHVSPVTGTPEDRVRRAQIAAQMIAENVALHRDTASAFQALLESPPHLANILNPDLSRIGLASLRAPEGVWVTQVFTRPPAAVASTAPVAPAPVEAPVEDAPAVAPSVFDLIPPFVEQMLAPAPDAPSTEGGRVAPRARSAETPTSRPSRTALSPTAAATLRELVGLAQSLLAGADESALEEDPEQGAR